MGKNLEILQMGGYSVMYAFTFIFIISHSWHIKSILVPPNYLIFIDWGDINTLPLDATGNVIMTSNNGNLSINFHPSQPLAASINYTISCPVIAAAKIRISVEATATHLKFYSSN